MLVEGRCTAASAQGIAQALYEEVALRRVRHPAHLEPDHVPDARGERARRRSRPARTETPTPLNPLGAKGIGESATIGSTPAVLNAVVDALSHLGVRHLDPPLSPERVWRAIVEATG